VDSRLVSVPIEGLIWVGMNVKAVVDRLALSAILARRAIWDGVRGTEIRDSNPPGMGWNGSGEYPARIDPPGEPSPEPGVDKAIVCIEWLVVVVMVKPRGTARGETNPGKAAPGDRGRVTAEDGVGRDGVGERSKSQLGMVEGVAVYSVRDVLGVSY
jgi:hypothetical protein